MRDFYDGATSRRQAKGGRKSGWVGGWVGGREVGREGGREGGRQAGSWWVGCRVGVQFARKDSPRRQVGNKECGSMRVHLDGDAMWGRF